MITGTITRRVNDVRNEIFRSFYTKKDFENRLKKLYEAMESSARYSIIANIVSMFEAIGVECKKDGDYEYYKNLVVSLKIDEPEELEDKIIDFLYSHFEEYPKPEDYMQRLVNRLSFPEDKWSADTLRLRILKQFIKYGNYLADAGYGGKGFIKKYVNDNMSEEQKKEYKQKIEQFHTSEQCLKIDERLKELKRKKQQLIEEEKNEQSQLKEKKKKYEEQLLILEYINDGIFDAYLNELKENNSRELRKPRGKFGLIRLADDLAKGRFKAGGATRKELYLFAMVYNMTYYTGDSEELIVYEKDIVKNLFEDYYNNNLMRFITEEYKKNTGALEFDPSGQGINYKNFAEMIYIYFIGKTGYTPAEKIYLSHKMIEEVKSEYQKGYVELLAKDNATVNYMDLFTDDILRKTESEFKKFILDNYDCNTEVSSDGKSSSIKGEIQIATEQETAFNVYKDLIEELDPKEYNYGLWFPNTLDFDAGEETKESALISMLKNERRSGTKFDEEKKVKKIKDLLLLLKNINSFVRKKAFSIESKEQITRTAIMAAYYYEFNTRHEALKNPMTFREVYEEYTNSINGLNSALDEAHYQPINDKSIFDTVLIFSSYAYLNDIF